jgi:hypothetical protein
MTRGSNMFAEGSKFKMTFKDDSQRVIGHLVWPTLLPVAENNHFKEIIPENLKDYVRIIINNCEFIIKFEIAKERSYSNDFKFMLIAGEQTIASALVSQQKGILSRPIIEILTPVASKLLSSGFFSTRYFYEVKDVQVGQIYEPSIFTLVSRKFKIDLPNSLAPEVQAFIFFLAMNQLFR